MSGTQYSPQLPRRPRSESNRKKTQDDEGRHQTNTGGRQVRFNQPQQSVNTVLEREEVIQHANYSPYIDVNQLLLYEDEEFMERDLKSENY